MNRIIAACILCAVWVTLGFYVGYAASEKRIVEALKYPGVGDCLLGRLLLPALPKEAIP